MANAPDETLPALIRRAACGCSICTGRPTPGTSAATSCIDCLIVLHHAVLRPDDIFLLSKATPPERSTPLSGREES